MPVTIQQTPLYRTIPTGSEIIFTVLDSTVTNNYKGKYVAEVWINQDAAVLGTGTPTTTLKVNPNRVGRGIFDFSSIFDNYVSPDYEGGRAAFTNITSELSSFKGLDHSAAYPHSIHLIDNWCGNQNACRYFMINFYTEYATSLTEPVIADHSVDKSTDKFLIFNGYLDHTTHLLANLTQDYGTRDFPGIQAATGTVDPNTGSFLTDAPLKQYLREGDFMTVAILNNLSGSSHNIVMEVTSVKIQFYLDGATTGVASANMVNTNGGYTGSDLDSNIAIQYFGCGLANYKNTNFPMPASWDYYTVQARSGSTLLGLPYEFHLQTDDCKGYETIRLTWLNKWGTWDYYNFTKKSTRTTNKKPVHYNQYRGTWNDASYSIWGRKGGKRVINNVVTEEITVNSDYILESEAEWLEQLFVSNDVFLLNQNDYYDGTGTNNDHPYFGYTGYTQKYVEPVIITSSTHIKKTKANDRLIQYSFDIERSKRKRTHRG